MNSTEGPFRLERPAMVHEPRRDRTPRIAILALGACVATVATTGFGIAVLAIAEHSEREAIAQTVRLEAAVSGANVAARSFADRTIAWKDLVFHGGDARDRARLRAAFASRSTRTTEALESLTEQGRAAGLPLEGVESAIGRVSVVETLLAERAADLRSERDVDVDALRTVDREADPAIAQAAFEIDQVAERWSKLAAERRTTQAEADAERVRRLRAWFEILALATSVTVIATAVGSIAAARRRDRTHAPAPAGPTA